MIAKALESYSYSFFCNPTYVATTQGDIDYEVRVLWYLQYAIQVPSTDSAINIW